MRNSLFLISLALSSAACSPTVDESTTSASKTAPQSETPAPPATPATTDAKASNFEDNDKRGEGSREFAYSWPAAVSRIPELSDQLASERDRQLASQKKEWAESFSSSPSDCISCVSRGFEKEWKVVADLPDWLSLSADLYVYSGGAHGNSGKSSLVWDRRAKTARDGVEMFKSPVALERALGAKLCDALDQEREQRRGAPVVRDAEWSTDCPGIDEATVLVGSSNGETFDRIGVYFGPYVAGAYAEGAYELDFPVTASVLDAVKPEYSNVFGINR